MATGVDLGPELALALLLAVAAYWFVRLARLYFSIWRQNLVAQYCIGCGNVVPGRSMRWTDSGRWICRGCDRPPALPKPTPVEDPKSARRVKSFEYQESAVACRCDICDETERDQQRATYVASRARPLVLPEGAQVITVGDVTVARDQFRNNNREYWLVSERMHEYQEAMQHLLCSGITSVQEYRELEARHLEMRDRLEELKQDNLRIARDAQIRAQFTAEGTPPIVQTPKFEIVTWGGEVVRKIN